MDRILLNSLRLKIVLNQQRDSSVLMADDASRDCTVRIIEAQLCVQYVKLSDEKYRNIQQSLPATPACYSFKCMVMKTHSVTQGISSLNRENARVGQLRNRVFMATVDNDACITKNPFKCLNVSVHLKWRSI